MFFLLICLSKVALATNMIPKHAVVNGIWMFVRALNSPSSIALCLLQSCEKHRFIAEMFTEV